MFRSRSIVFLISVIFVFQLIPGCLDDDSVDDDITPVYVTIYSHNEDNWDTFIRDRDSYVNYRDDLKAKVDLIASYGAKLNWQSDIDVLEFMLEYERGPLLNDTNGKPILQYMSEDLGFGIDPHGHLISCNYADLAYLIEQNGVKTPEVIGGLRLFEWGDEYLDTFSFRNWKKEIQLRQNGTIEGRLYPGYFWKPAILSVPAFSGHWFDEYSSGVWKPGNEDEFFDHDETSDILYVGQGYPHMRSNMGNKAASGCSILQENTEYIEELVGKIEDGELPKGKMYTASVHVRDLPVVSSDGEEIISLDGLETVLEKLAPLEEKGKIIFVTYQEAVQVWEEEYGNEVNRVDISEFSIYEEMMDQAREEKENN